MQFINCINCRRDVCKRYVYYMCVYGWMLVCESACVYYTVNFKEFLAQQMKWAFLIPDGFIISKVLRVCGMEDNESQLYLVS